jgi:hypothetical protein
MGFIIICECAYHFAGGGAIFHSLKFTFYIDDRLFLRIDRFFILYIIYYTSVCGLMIVLCIIVIRLNWVRM